MLERAAQLLAEEKEGLVTDEHIRALMKEIEVERELLLNDSPYPEVRAVVDNTDDISIPCSTFRAWFLGIFFSIIGTAINTLFSFRQPGIYVSGFTAQLLAYVFGIGLAKILPTHQFRIFKWSFSLNPGAFSQKERE